MKGARVERARTDETNKNPMVRPFADAFRLVALTVNDLTKPTFSCAYALNSVKEVASHSHRNLHRVPLARF
jgi:hypothetical protein